MSTHSKLTWLTFDCIIQLITYVIAKRDDDGLYIGAASHCQSGCFEEVTLPEFAANK